MRDVQQGMTVRSSDGEKLGKIVSCEADQFVIEKGFFFQKEYLASYDDIAELRGDDVILRRTGGELRKPIPGAGEGYVAGERAERMPPGVTEHVSVPVAEEELSAEKRMREAGQVTIHKDVKTERRDISVPVTKEEVHVERTPAGAEARPSEATFREQTVSVPIHEEEVEIRKRPVVREEVRISKAAREEELRASEDVRKEEARVEKEGDVDPKTRE